MLSCAPGYLILTQKLSFYLLTTWAILIKYLVENALSFNVQLVFAFIVSTTLDESQVNKKIKRDFVTYMLRQ